MIQMRQYSIVMLCLLLTSCASSVVSPSETKISQTDEPEKVQSNFLRDDESHSSLPDLGVAPELENEVWLNVDQPLRLADLRGKVVLLDMWTFG